MPTLKQHLGLQKNYLQLTLGELEEGIKSYIKSVNLHGVTGIAKVRTGILDQLVEKGKSDQQALPSFGGKGNYDTFIDTADQTLQQARGDLIVVPDLDPNVDLTQRTVVQMMEQFVIDSHQFKHYANGSGKYGLFDDLGFEEVHQLIVYATAQIITEQKDRDFPTVQDGYVVVTGARHDRWPAGTGKGRTNTVKIQLGAKGDSFSGHGYPVGQAQFDTEVRVGQKFLSVDVNNNDWQNVQLTARNTERRNRVQG